MDNVIKKVKSGERPKAKTINDLIDFATDAGYYSSGTIGSKKYQFICLANNLEAAALEAYDVVVIRDQPQHRPQNQLNVILNVALATAGDNLESFAVVLDKIPVGSCGRICIGGLAWALTDGGAGSFGALEAGHLYLTGGDAGPAHILAVTDNNLALIRFPAGSSAGSDLFQNHLHEAFIIQASD